MTDESPNNVDMPTVCTPELDDYLVLLSRLEELEARVVELERRLLVGPDGTLH
jgi:hypothetical protein